ncbi:MAG: phytanoyl-CoA dioxygenase family protein [Pseudomonadales bacterium]|jgi:ectoine hydroxylase-related dioxygenase (phytanoyl-CoA dioxygenase family)|nr:phytanoyl-CoA dioxygenase family protein [Pseudomonadales bacterium]
MIHRKMGYLTAGNRNAGAAAEHLEQYGYVLVPGVLSESEVAALASEINHVFATQPPDERSDRSEEANAMFRYGMLNHSALCQDMVAHRGILDVIEPLLGEDCHVIANTAWRNPPNSIGMHGGEAWHIDAGPHVPLAEGVTWPADIPHPTFAVGVHIYLRECTLQDGPTGVLAGSHLSGRFPPSDRRLDDDLTYNEQAVIPLLAQPGDVGFFVSDIWHRRMPTRPGDQGRFFLQVHYGRRDIAQRISTTDDTNHLSSDAVSRAVTPRQKTVVGLHAPMFYDG